MEEKKGSRKRKQPPANPFTGAFTRQKARIFFHSNRSGISRPDPLPKPTSFPQNSQKLGNNSRTGKLQKSRLKEHGDGHDEAAYYVSIKDLRARRIFSKPLTTNEAQLKPPLDCLGEFEVGKNPNSDLYSGMNNGEKDVFEGKSVCHEKSSQEIRSDMGTNLRSVASSDCENPNLSTAAESECASKNDVESEGLNGGSPNSSMSEKCDSERVDNQIGVSIAENPNLLVVERCDKSVDFKEGSSIDGNPNPSVSSAEASDTNGEILDGVKVEKFDLALNFVVKISDNLNPNLSEKVLKREVNGKTCEGFTEEIVQTTPPDAVVHVQQSDDITSSRSPPKKISPSKEKISSYDSKRNMVLKPCSRMKVFRAPNSFSYRRLLPYLMDIAKDTSSPLKVNPHPKVEVDAAEKHVVSSSEESIMDTPTLDEKPLRSQPCLASHETSSNRKEKEMIRLEPNAGDFKDDQAAVETPVNCSQEKSQAKCISPQNQIENPMQNVSQKEFVSPDEQVALDNIDVQQDIRVIAATNQVDSSLASKESPEARSQLSPYAEGKCRTAHVEVKPDEDLISVLQSSAKLEPDVSSSARVAGLAKGILKSNPRGCRGLCNCLNCASFRLNAGKAFEFSRNQMLDAEELVFDMMKELSSFRLMMEKSINGGKSHAILPFEQVQEACRRASNMEDIVRNRLSQMNEDLYFHCRTKSLERPRVNFSSHVEEKFIGKSTRQNRRI